MVRLLVIEQERSLGFPHTRGDGPPTKKEKIEMLSFPPHTWGWSVAVGRFEVALQVFPTHVGMVRYEVGGFSLGDSFLHTRGDSSMDQL